MRSTCVRQVVCLILTAAYAEGDVDLLASDDYWDPHAIAGLLKTFLRELPASILTRDLHLRFLSVIGTLPIFSLYVQTPHS